MQLVLRQPWRHLSGFAAFLGLELKLAVIPRHHCVREWSCEGLIGSREATLGPLVPPPRGSTAGLATGLGRKGYSGVQVLIVPVLPLPGHPGDLYLAHRPCRLMSNCLSHFGVLSTLHALYFLFTDEDIDAQRG